MANQMYMSRREVLAAATALTVMSCLPQDLIAAVAKGDMPYRKLGRTGEKVSLIGLGGSHIGKQADEKDSIEIIRTAIDNGVNFMDNCWDYNDGKSEIRMGKALKDGYRNKVFLMSKIDGRDRQTATRQIDESLRRLQTDRIDLMQIHEVIRMSDADKSFSAGGCMEALLAAKQAGKIRYIGFTRPQKPCHAFENAGGGRKASVCF